MRSNLHTDWTKHLRNKEDKENFEQLVRNSVQVLSRLKDIFLERQKTLTNAEHSSSSYDNPSWAYKQADRIGRRGAWNEAEDLLAFLP